MASGCYFTGQFQSKQTYNTHTQTHMSKRTTKHIENSVLKIMKYDKKQNNKIYIK